MGRFSFIRVRAPARGCQVLTGSHLRKLAVLIRDKRGYDGGKVPLPPFLIFYAEMESLTPPIRLAAPLSAEWWGGLQSVFVKRERAVGNHIPAHCHSGIILSP